MKHITMDMHKPAAENDYYISIDYENKKCVGYNVTRICEGRTELVARRSVSKETQEEFNEIIRETIKYYNAEIM